MITIVLLTDRMMPNALLMITSDDPPRLIMGRVCPVTGMMPMLTKMCRKACSMMRVDSPSTVIREKSLLHELAILRQR